MGHRSAKPFRWGSPVKAGLLIRLGIRSPLETALLGAAVVLILLFLIDLVIIWQRNIRREAVNPASVVYGEPMHITPGLPDDLVASGETTASATGPAPGSEPPGLRIDRALYDLGRIGSRQPVSQVIPIRNNGPGVLRITRGYTTCGCTTADLTAVEIPPGKTALLTVTFNPAFHNLQGVTVRRGVILETNDPQHPVVELWIQAAVK